MTGPHLTPEREAEIRARDAQCDVPGAVLSVADVHRRNLLAALDAERAAHAQTRTALTDGVEAVTRALASLSPRFGASVLVHDLDRWSMEAQRVLGLAVAEADKPHDGNER